MIILGIETSCDETAIAVVETDEPRTRTCFTRSVRGRRGYQCGKTRKFKILSNVVSSQVELHKKYGGVWPTLAKREHQKNLVPVLEKTLKGAKILKNQKHAPYRPAPEKSWCGAGAGSKIPEVKPSASYRTGKNFTLPNFRRKFGRARNDKLKFKTLKKILYREPELLKQTLHFLKKYQKPEVDPHTKNFGVGVDLIAVTAGPGLEPCLWVGVNFAKALSYIWNMPIVPVNHIKAHIIANWLSPISSKSKIKNFTPHQSKAWYGARKSKLQSKNQNLFPAVCLVVSGGHTQLILMRGFGKYKIIGETRDDAAGECFDKTARILGLGYPGGPEISKMAEKAKSNKFKIKLPRPMISQKNYDFSFSGLKTAVLYLYKNQKNKSGQYKKEMAREIQNSIVDVLVKKTIKSARDIKVKTIILGGGVMANKELRKRFKAERLKNIELLMPEVKLSTDNAAMVAAAGYYGWLRGEIREWQEIEAEANLRLE